ncbi:MAG TPA: O-antigen ligase family protein [Clostridia bacterium]|nr:O-antigen ligase family protein [Clostridia bacterium]
MKTNLLSGAGDVDMIRKGKENSFFAWMADISLLICLFLEIVFAHTIGSQASLVLFFCFTALLAFQKRRVYFSWWMWISALLIVWSVIVSFGWAIDRSASLGLVKTLIVTTAFFFFIFQYLLLRADLRRFLVIYVISALLMVCWLLFREYSLDWNTARLGYTDGVHPNSVGMISAFAFGMCIYLAEKKWKLLWLIPASVLLIAVALTMSVKSAALAGALLVSMLLIRYPRKWGWKLVAIGVGGFALFYAVILTENPLSTGVLSRVREVALFFLKGEGVGGSSVERMSLMQAAWARFQERPITGWGLGCFRLLEGSLGMYAHNNYLELLVSGGIPMALIYYAGQVGALIYAAHEIKRSRATDKTGKDAMLRQLTVVFYVMLVMRFVLDFAVVSYYERQDAIFIILLVAAAKQLNATRKENVDSTTGGEAFEN